MQKFEPDQLVLVKFGNGAPWRLRRYSMSCDKGKGHETQDGVVWPDDCIIPYAGNEHLLGTTNSPKPKWEPKPGELVAVRHSLVEEWKVRVFRYRAHDNSFACYDERDRKEIRYWGYCEPLRKHFTIPEE